MWGRFIPQSADEEQHRRKSGFVSLGGTDADPLHLSHAVFFGHHFPAGINLPVVIKTFLTMKNAVLRMTRAHTCTMYVHSFSAYFFGQVTSKRSSSIAELPTYKRESLL